MKHLRFRTWPLLLLAALGIFASCTPPAPAVVSPTLTVAPEPSGSAAVDPGPQAPSPDPGAVAPVTASDVVWGDPLAPVTWVIWGDYECSYTSKLFLRLDSFMSTYGPKQLRLVWRHYPVQSHEHAWDRAVAAEAVRRLGGARAFLSFSQKLLLHRDQVAPEDLERWAGETGVDTRAFKKAVAADTDAARVDEDIEQSKKLGVGGTPASFINGVFIDGLQPDDKLAAVIDAQLAVARDLVAGGLPPENVYAAVVEKNFDETRPRPEPPDTTVWKVPLGKSPVHGKPTALVTMVMFSDFECPFCAKAHEKVEALEKLYGDRLRLVFKHNPLPFHTRAEPAAQLAIEARAQGGDAKFWEAYDLLFANRENLADEDLEKHAATLKLPWKKVSAAVTSHKHAAVIDADQVEAEDLHAWGTPHFFINGRRLVGNQPLDSFKVLIDEGLAKASALLAAGTPAAKIYETLQKDGHDPLPPDRILLPAPPGASPAKGAKAGPKVVTVQFFGDFECSFCKRAAPIMDDLVAAFPGKVRVVWRHLPLPMHKQAQIASEASVEAFSQKGDAGFWAFAKLLWEDQGALDKESLIKKAIAAGLDEGKMRSALDKGTHRATVQADADVAAGANLTGTPAFAVGDYFVAGAQSLARYKRAVKWALGPRVEPTPETIVNTRKAKVDVASRGAPAGKRFGAKHLLVMYQGSMRAPANVTRTKVEALARAQEARKKALAGEKFEDLVAAYSDEPGAAARGGGLGLFPRGRMVEPFQKGLEQTTVGAISEVVETPFGFHVILRTK